MEKVEVITKHTQGNPIDKVGVTWIEFLQDLKAENEEQINNVAMALLRGSMLFIDGYTYFLTGINLRDTDGL